MRDLAPALVVAALVLAGCSAGSSSPHPGDPDGRGGVTRDPFGVPLLHPTAPGGREWYLGDATIQGAEWYAETDNVEPVEDGGATTGVFRTVGGDEGDDSDGEVRLNVASPPGKAWWQNVEMTAYFSYEADHDTPGQLRHFELLARTERHSDGTTTKSNIDADRSAARPTGVPAPPGTRTWPWYDAMPSTAQVTERCLGTSYHANFYPETDDGSTVLFEKEVSHDPGYADQKGKAIVSGWDPLAPHGWFGMKFVVRNSADGKRVHLELWIDPEASGTFVQASSVDDTAGSWLGAAEGIHEAHCDVAPYGYSDGMLLDWAGPWVIFRSDGMIIRFKWLSVREIGPLP